MEKEKTSYRSQRRAARSHANQKQEIKVGRTARGIVDSPLEQNKAPPHRAYALRRSVLSAAGYQLRPSKLDAPRRSLGAASTPSVVNVCYKAGGGTSPYDSSPLQRHLRDINALTQHLLVADERFTRTGAFLAGKDPGLGIG